MKLLRYCLTVGVIFGILLHEIDAVGFIANTKIDDCSSGNCISMCEFENLKLLPETEVVHDGKCRKVRCNKDFSIIVK